MSKEEIRVRRLTPDLLPQLENLFSDSKVTSRCWCMYWRIGPEYRKRTPEENKNSFHRVVKKGSPLGLIAFKSKLPVGWC